MSRTDAYTTINAPGEDLIAALRSTGVVVEARAADRRASAHDASHYLLTPRAVVVPRSADEVAAVFAQARRLRVLRYKRKLGPDPASEIACTIGGVVANNSSGWPAEPSTTPTEPSNPRSSSSRAAPSSTLRFPALSRVAVGVADEVIVPDAWGCCAFAGDRGMLHPELTASATTLEAEEVRAVGATDGPTLSACAQVLDDIPTEAPAPNGSGRKGH